VPDGGVAVDPAALEPQAMIDEALDEDALGWIQALAPELPASRVAAVVSRVTGIARERVYAAVQKMRPGRDDGGAGGST
jgi:DNA-binding phage protein